MTKELIKPYVISADSTGLLQRWSKKEKLTLPSESYLNGMLTELGIVLRDYFRAVDTVSEEDLRREMNNFVRQSTIPVVSLDRVYVAPNQKNLVGFLDASRTVDQDLNDQGLGTRVLWLTVDRQIGQLSQRLSGRTIALVDDVIFAGQTLRQIINKFKQWGVTVETVFAGIAVQEGITLLNQQGITVQQFIPYDAVIDEICQRDFGIGIPMSGRSVINGRGVEGAPYLYPFGKPVEWASIPAEKAEDFSDFCVAQALRLWTKIEQLSNQSVSTQRLAKPVFGLPDNPSMSAALKQVKNRGGGV
jgi:hypothetical protein